jgi:hypothetical protein
MKIAFFKKPIIKNILSIIVIPIFGFILLNITFLLNAVFQGILRRFLMIFINFDTEMNFRWLPGLMRILFVVFILIISFFVLRTKMKPIFKAIFLFVPTATILVTIGIFFYQIPAISYVIGFLLISGVIYYFYKTKQPWLYYYSVILISLVLAVFTLTGGEI